MMLPGCYTPGEGPGEPPVPAEVSVDFNDPLLNQRQVLLFGPIDQRAADSTIQKLLFLEGQNHEPIDLFLQTPGGEFKHAMAIEQVMRLLRSPVNTYALSECNSGGALLLAAGTGKRRAFQGALVVLHGLKVSGNPPPGLAEEIQKTYMEFWRRHARLPDSWFPFPLDCVHVLTPEQAKEYGIVDEVVSN